MADVDFKADISIVGASDQLSVEPHVTHIHDALEIKNDPPTLPCLIWRDGEDIPSHPHLLECPGTQAALEVARLVAVVALLIITRRYPWLLNLEVMGQVDGAPPSGECVYILWSGHIIDVTEMELPSEIEVDSLPRSVSSRGT